MATGGGAMPSVNMKIVDGRLQVGRQTLWQNVVNDMDRAIHKLLDGEEVFVAVCGGLAERVGKTVMLALRQEETDAPDDQPE
jgi:hypothetical protein